MRLLTLSPVVVTIGAKYIGDECNRLKWRHDVRNHRLGGLPA